MPGSITHPSVDARNLANNVIEVGPGMKYTTIQGGIDAVIEGAGGTQLIRSIICDQTLPATGDWARIRVYGATNNLLSDYTYSYDNPPPGGLAAGSTRIAWDGVTLDACAIGGAQSAAFIETSYFQPCYTLSVDVSSTPRYMVVTANNPKWIRAVDIESGLTAPVQVDVYYGIYDEEVNLPDYVHLIAKGKLKPNITGMVAIAGSHAVLDGFNVDSVDGCGFAVYLGCHGRDMEDVRITNNDLAHDAWCIGNNTDPLQMVSSNMITGLVIEGNYLDASNPIFIQSEYSNVVIQSNEWHYDGSASSCYSFLDKPNGGGFTRAVNVLNNHGWARSSGQSTVYWVNIGSQGWKVAGNVMTMDCQKTGGITNMTFVRHECTPDASIVTEYGKEPNIVTDNTVVTTGLYAVDSVVRGLASVGGADFYVARNVLHSHALAGSGTDYRFKSEAGSDTINYVAGGMAGFENTEDSIGAGSSLVTLT